MVTEELVAFVGKLIFSTLLVVWGKRFRSTVGIPIWAVSQGYKLACLPEAFLSMTRNKMLESFPMKLNLMLLLCLENSIM